MMGADVANTGIANAGIANAGIANAGIANAGIANVGDLADWVREHIYGATFVSTRQSGVLPYMSVTADIDNETWIFCFVNSDDGHDIHGLNVSAHFNFVVTVTEVSEGIAEFIEAYA